MINNRLSGTISTDDLATDIIGNPWANFRVDNDSILSGSFISTPEAPVGDYVDYGRSETNAYAGSALDIQVGGSHYDYPIQPIDFIMKNGFDFCQGNAIKYIIRHKDKNGIEDIEKAIHYMKMLAKIEYDIDL